MPAPHLQFRIAEIDARRATPGTLVECLRFDSDGHQAKQGSLLAFAEIQSSLYVYERLLDTVHAAITQARTMVTGMEGDPMIRFEKIIQKVNEAMAAFAAAEATQVQWHKVNLFVFQLAEEHLCFSGHGSLANVFLQHQEGGDAKAFDLLGSLEQPIETDPQKPLSSIVCGTMGVGDVLFVGTQNIQPIREQVEIVSLCRTQPPVTAALEIQQRLQDRSSLESYFGIVIAGVALTAAKAAKTVQVAAPLPDPVVMDPEPAPSLHQFEQETTEIMEQGSLEPGANFGRIFDSVKEKGAELRRAFKERTAKRARTAAAEDAPLSPISLAGLRSMNSGYTRGIIAEKKTAIIIGLVVVAIVTGGGLWLKSVNKKQAEQKLWTAVYDQSVEAKNRSEAALVYGDEDRARAQYQAALTAFQQLDQKTPDRLNAKSTLEKELNDVRTRLRKEQVVPSPALVADLGANGQAAQATSLVVQNAFAYAIDTAQNALRTVNLNDGTVGSLAAPEGTTLLAVGTGQTEPLIVGSNRAIFTVKNGTLTPFSVPSTSKASSTIGLTTYGKRVYSLDTQSGMIWRYSASTNALSAESAYLKAASDEVRRSTGIAIDSSVYITSDDHLVKYTSGERDNWSLATTDPPAKTLTSVWTVADANVIVSADPQNKRVLIFNKSGKLVTQIVSPVFQGPTSAWGDLASNTLYILDGGKIYKLDLPRA